MAVPTALTPFDTTYAGSLSYVDVTIPSGASVPAAAVDLAECTPLAVALPATWTAAVVSFSVSRDNSAFGGLYNAAGEVVSTTAFAGGEFLALSPLDFVGVRYLKIRSGSAGSPVTQGADRVVRLIVRKL